MLSSRIPAGSAISLVLVMAVVNLKADFMTDWNNLALAQIRTTSTDSLNASRDLAIVTLSIYDAVNGINPVDPLYYTTGSAAAGASADAAVAKSAYDAMTAIFGSNSAFTSLYNSQIASLGPTNSSITNGISWGGTAASSVLSARSGDGASSANTSYSGPSGPGFWAPTPPGNNPNPLLPGWGSVTPFAMNTGSQFRPNGPPSLDAGQYLSDFNEVSLVGQNSSGTRTADQTNLAHFWADGTGTVTPTGHWNQIAQTVTASLTLNEKARVFAAMNVAMADATIAAWDSKYTYTDWRPVTAIQAGGNTGWTPLVVTPNSPGYVSEVAAVAGAAATSLALLFNNDAASLTLTADTNGDGVADMTRSFSSFSGAAAEAAVSGVDGGTQFRYSTADGLTMGTAVGQLVTLNNFAPVPEPSGAVCVMAAGLLLILKSRRSFTRRG